MSYKMLLLCAVAALFVLPAHAAKETQIDMIYDKVERLEKDVMALQRRSYGGASRPIVESAAPSTPSSNTSLDEIYNQLQAREKEMQELTAKIEKLEFNQKQLEEKLKRMNDDVDMRLSMNEKKAAASTPATNASASKTADSATIKAEYDKAYNAMKKGDYKTSEKLFTAFMKKYPNSDLAGNANYWLGETYYARKQYEEAVGIFADGFTKYKNNSKAPDNLLKLGLSMKALNRKTDACTAFTALPKEFSKAQQTLKDRAKAEAKKLGCK